MVDIYVYTIAYYVERCSNIRVVGDRYWNGEVRYFFSKVFH